MLLVGWAFAAFHRRGGASPRKPAAPRREGVFLRAAMEAFGRALIEIGDDGPVLIAGEEVLARCATLLQIPEKGDEGGAAGVIAALCRGRPDVTRALDDFVRFGTPFDRLVRTGADAVRASGRAAGGLALLTLEIGEVVQEAPIDHAPNVAALLESYPGPACVTDDSGRPVLANGAWLGQEGGVDPGVVRLASEALSAGVAQEHLRWLGPSADRRAIRLVAVPLAEGGAGVWSWDVTRAEGAADALARRVAAQDLILAEVADAVAVFDTDDRLSFSNSAFARLWELEAAWLANGPTHGALLDRLRRDRRLPETADFVKFRAAEIARRERLDPAPEAIWRVAGDRTLRVLSLPHPGGGLVRLFSDITPEIRLKSQWTQLIQVRQATLDKLTDAVAVFGADAKLKLHNEAFQALWGIAAGDLMAEPGFDAIAERCLMRVHDGRFWAELKGRITDPDPGVRAAMSGELATGDGRRIAWQSRPLPDGATLVSFVDVTDARRVEGALADREAALRSAEQLGRDFVSSVSYELRTPLTTILGYAELLETGEDSLSDRARSWVAAVRSAAGQLARTVEDILAFAELDAGEMTLDLAPVPALTLLSDVEALWRARAAAAGVNLRIDGDGGGVVRADRSRLDRALDHLVDHALRQTPTGGEIRLSARRSAGEVCFEVADNGRGVPFHVQAHVFDRFSGDEGAGAGFGLALVKALVELHGGWVALESAPGAGAIFTCHLPENGGEA
jgi:signal transduction histidine kinase